MLLPKLEMAVDDAALERFEIEMDHAPSADALRRTYAGQLHRRRSGSSYALYQRAGSGRFTMPHVDDDRNRPPVSMSTFIFVLQGSEIIVAWNRLDMHEDRVIQGLRAEAPSLEFLHGVPSLTVVRAQAGDVVYLPRDAVHMVVSETFKVHYALHVYEDEDE